MAGLSVEEARAHYDALGRGQDGQAFYEDPAFDWLIAHCPLFDKNGLDVTDKSAAVCDVIEFGCGTGRFARRLLLDVLSDTTRYLGQDVSDVMVGLTNERLSDFGERARAEHTDGSVTLLAADGDCDVVIATFVLDLLSLKDQQRFLAEAHRVLRPGGVILLASLSADGRGWRRLTMRLWSAIYRVAPGRVGGCRPVSLAGLVGGARAEGWKIAKSTHFGAGALSVDCLVAFPENP